jgi:hypothetical protein
MNLNRSLGILLAIMTGCLLLTSPIYANPPKIDKLDPAQAYNGAQIAIIGTDLDGAKSVTIGGVDVGIARNTSTRIDTSMPLVQPGCCMSLPVIVRFADGKTVKSPEPASYPLAIMGIKGPLPFPAPTAMPSDPAWVNGGFGLPSPTQSLNGTASLGFFHLDPTVIGNLGTVNTNEDSPTFYVLTQFTDSGIARSTDPAKPVLGKRGFYSVAVSVCDPQSGKKPSADQACTDWDGNIGVWKVIPSAYQKQTLDWSGGVNTTNGMLTVALGTKIFDEKNLVHKLMFYFTVMEGDSPSGDTANLSREAYSFQQLTVVRAPTARLQLKVLPYTILYQPPGDESRTTVTMMEQFTTNFSLNNENDQSSKSTTADNDEIKAGMTLGYEGEGAKVGASVGTTQTWDNSTEYGFGTTSTDKGTNQAINSFSYTWSPDPIDTLIPGSGETCTSETNCATPIANPNAYELEPFWRDVFVLLVHPQFATWEQLAGSQLTVMTAAVPVVANITVADLAACAGGEEPIPGIDQCAIPYSDDNLVAKGGKSVVYRGTENKVVLTKKEASNLLALDPFFGHGQGAELDVTRVTKIESPNYGARVGNSPVQQSINVSNTSGHEQDTSGTTEYDATVTSVIGTSTSFGLSLTLPILGDSLSVGDTVTDTGSTETKLTYGNSSAVSSTKTTTAIGLLDDSDNVYGKDPKFHGPLPKQPSVNVFLDKRFGGFMYQDPYAPGPGSIQANMRRMVVAELLQKEHTINRFSDVPTSNIAHDAIGVLARAKLLPSPQPGAASDKFEPAALISRADFAVLLARAARLPDGPRQTGFADVPATDSRSVAITAVVSKGFMASATTTTFAPNAPLMKSTMAAALAQAFTLPAATSSATPDSTVDRASAAQAVIAALSSE